MVRFLFPIQQDVQERMADGVGLGVAPRPAAHTAPQRRGGRLCLLLPAARELASSSALRQHTFL